MTKEVQIKPKRKIAFEKDELVESSEKTEILCGVRGTIEAKC